MQISLKDLTFFNIMALNIMNGTLKAVVAAVVVEREWHGSGGGNKLSCVCVYININKFFVRCDQRYTFHINLDFP